MCLRCMTPLKDKNDPVIQQHVMKESKGVEVNCTHEPRQQTEVCGKPHAHGESSVGLDQIGGWLDWRPIMGVLATRKITSSNGELNP
jgi:hypothetical protein